VLEAKERIERLEPYTITRSRQRYQRFFESSGDLLGIAGSDGRMHTINESWTRFLGKYAHDDACRNAGIHGSDHS
jgi:PAS domain-containing protein